MPRFAAAFILDVSPFGPRSIARVVPYADGGFALLAPYVHARDWLLLQFPVDYSRAGEFGYDLEHGVHRRFRSSRGVKLSVHGSGFVQFSRSGQSGILAGRDAAGEPRAFGYESFAPGRQWIRSGPYCAVAARGLDAWDAPKRRVAHEVVVEEGDLYDESAHAPPPSEPTFVFEFWVIPRLALVESRSRGRHRVAEMPPHPYYGSRQIVQLIVVDIGQLLYVLGLVVTRAAFDMPDPVGVTISAPSNLAQTMAMIAMSPDPFPTADSADYQPGLERLPFRRVVAPPDYRPHGPLHRPWERGR